MHTPSRRFSTVLFIWLIMAARCGCADCGLGANNKIRQITQLQRCTQS